MNEQVDDIRAILDETGCQRAVLVGNSAGCAPALVFAATHPGRVESLVLLSGYARLRAGAGYPQGLGQAHIDQIAEAILGTWGTGADLDLIAPTMAADDDFRRWYAQIQRLSASPATAAAMIRLWYDFDVRSVLPAIKVPTLVIARAGNATLPAHHSRYLAEHIAGAKYLEFPDTDLLYFTGNADQVLDAIEEWVTGTRPLPSPDRFLGTVLFVDVAGSTQLAAEIGDSLARAIACAEAVRDGVRALGLQVRAGVHTGEMEHGPAGEVRGIAVHTGARVAALAGPGEVLVSRTIRDLVAGAPIRLESRGAHELKGVPGSWEVFAVTG